MNSIQKEISVNPEREHQTENICPECLIQMDTIFKGKKVNRYDKERTVYKCFVCGFTHRKRTLNEVLRDLDMRDEHEIYNKPS